MLLAGVAVDGAAVAAAGQQFAVGFVGGGAVYGIAHHLHAHAAQPIGQQGAGCSSIILMEQSQAKQVGGLGCAVVANQYLGEAAVAVDIGGGDGLVTGVVDLLQATAIPTRMTK
jgi:hypothetical protein